MADTSAPPFAEFGFTDLGVPESVAAAAADSGFDTPFPIQTATLPDSIAGRDVLGRGRTGSGKTLAFALPVVIRLMANDREREPGRPRALILAPTRELASQIYRTVDGIARPLGFRTATVYGGIPAKPQIAALRKGVDIVVACPGRLEDLLQQKALTLQGIEITVLDEADHMADLGFLPSVKRLLDRTPAGTQRLLFSATLDRGVDGLVKQYLRNPVTHSVDSAESPVATMEHHLLNVTSENRMAVLIELLSTPGKTIVFTRTKHKAKALARSLNKNGIPSVDMHSNLAQNARVRNLAAFSDGRATTMVATDIAARGIHVDDVALVIHADPPVEHKAYLHRSGRTARAGNDGTVVTLVLPEQRGDVADLVRKAKISPTTTNATPDHPIIAELAPGERRRFTREEIAELLPFTVPQPASTKPGAKSGGKGSGGKSSGRSAGKTAGRKLAARNGGGSGGDSRGGLGDGSGDRTADGSPKRRKRTKKPTTGTGHGGAQASRHDGGSAGSRHRDDRQPAGSGRPTGPGRPTRKKPTAAGRSSRPR